MIPSDSDPPLEEMYAKLDLPSFLLTFEDFQTIKIPAMRNFAFKERETGKTAEELFSQGDAFTGHVSAADESMIRQAT